MTGFFIEQAVLSSITNKGLDISKDIAKPMDRVMFSSYPPYRKPENKEKDTIIYCSLALNFSGINGIIIQYYIFTRKNGKHKYFLFPFQITVTKSHSNSENKFFNKWSD